VQLPPPSIAGKRGDANPPELWASAEICDALAWTRRHLQLAREAGDFPEPLGVVARGKIAVWDAAQVRRWFADSGASERRREWRRDQALRLYRRGMAINAICRQLHAKPDTIRKWLKDAGETLPGERQRDASA
jgi:hypothetical protein